VASISYAARTTSGVTNGKIAISTATAEEVAVPMFWPMTPRRYHTAYHVTGGVILLPLIGQELTKRFAPPRYGQNSIPTIRRGERP